MIESQHISWRVVFTIPGFSEKREVSFRTRDSATDFFEERAAKDMRPILYKVTEKVELERFNVGDMMNGNQ